MIRYTQLSSRYLIKQKKRTILTILGVILSVALITGTGIIIESVRHQLIQSAIRDQGNFHVAFKNVTPRQAEIIRNHVEVAESCSSDLSTFALLAGVSSDEREVRNAPPYRLLQLVRNDTQAMEMLQAETQLLRGRLPSAADEIAVDERTLVILGGKHDIGSRVTFRLGQRRRLSDDSVIDDFFYPLLSDDGKSEERFVETGEKSYTITGILREEIFVSKNYSTSGITWQESGGRAERNPGTVFVLLDSVRNALGKAGVIARAAGIDSASIFSNEKLLYLHGAGPERNISDGVREFTSLILTIIVIATIAVIYNSFNISMVERVSQFGILRCVGATPAQIRKLIFHEASVVSAFGIPLGVLSGILSMYLVFDVVDALSMNPVFENIEVVFSLRVIVASLFIGYATVFLSALFPAWRAGKIPAVEAVRSTGMYNHERLKRTLLTRISGHVRNVSGILAVRNIGRNRKRFWVTMFSMVVSVVLYIAFSGLLQLTEATNVLYDPDLPGFKVESVSRIEDSVYRDIRAIDGVEVLYKYYEQEVELLVPEEKLSSYYREYVEGLDDFQRTEGSCLIPHSRILSYGDEALLLLEELVEDGGIDPDAMKRDRSVIFVQKAAFLNTKGREAYVPNATFHAGDTITLSGDGGKSLTIAAVLSDAFYDDYNPEEGAFDIIVSEELFTELSGRDGYQELYIKLKDGADKQPLVGYLENLIASRIEYSYTDVQMVADGFTRDFRAISLFFYGFIIIIAGIGCLNIINTISTNLIVRTREIGVIQAVGLDRKGLNRMIMSESVLYSICALFVGSLAGTGVWYLIVNVTGMVRETVFQIPWNQIGTAAAALLLISLLASYVPMKRIHRAPVVEKIRMIE